MGLALKELGQLFEAEKVLRDLLSDDPWNIDVATNLSGVLLEQGRPDLALEILHPIVRRAGHHSVGWDTLGACFLDNGDLDVALACFARAHEQAPLNPTPLFHIFAPLFERDIKQAIALLRHGLQTHPDRWDLDDTAPGMATRAQHLKGHNIYPTPLARLLAICHETSH